MTFAFTYPEGFRSRYTGLGALTQCPKKCFSSVYFKKYT